jgi:hypothetical protein
MPQFRKLIPPFPLVSGIGAIATGLALWSLLLWSVWRVSVGLF